MEPTIGQVIRHARHDRKMTLEDVAGPVGITPGALSHIESGRRLPNASNASRIAHVLGIPRETLLTLLDREHSRRRRHSADTDGDRDYEAEPNLAAMQPSRGLRARDAVYYELPIEELFGASAGSIRPASLAMPTPSESSPDGTPGSPTTSPESPARRMPRLNSMIANQSAPSFESMRSAARWSDDTAERLAAIERLADSASSAIRTIRGMLADEDPVVRREARRLLAELEVRLPEE